jgi:hypothetical protein
LGPAATPPTMTIFKGSAMIIASGKHIQYHGRARPRAPAQKSDFFIGKFIQI